MRGQQKSIKSLVLTGNVYLLHIDEEEISNAVSGDIYLYLHNEEELYPIVMNEYQSKGFKGYFKIKVFDGKTWCFVDNQDFFEDRVNQFSKTDIALYTYNICQERVESFKGRNVYRTYREHYTLEEYQQGEYKGKKTIKPK